MSSERLQKILSGAGVCSRREAEQWISGGRVTVNGRVATLGKQADLARDAVKIDGRLLRPDTRPHRYVLLHKPKGILTTTSDPEGRPTVLELLPAALRRGLKPVGRLDFSTEGLLLLTDDGEFSQAVSHPSHGCKKTYLVKVSGEPSEAKLEKLRRGIFLDERRLRPSEIAVSHRTARRGEGNTWLTVVLSEGRSRQIRRMFEVIGHKVSKLKRIGIGPLRDEKLPAGAYRALTLSEIQSLRRDAADHRRH